MLIKNLILDKILTMYSPFAEDNTQSEDIEKSNTNESEVTIEEEEEVDSEAFKR